jgi:hypothetical protein
LTGEKKNGFTAFIDCRPLRTRRDYETTKPRTGQQTHTKMIISAKPLFIENKAISSEKNLDF